MQAKVDVFMGHSLKANKKLPLQGIDRILIRGTNWIGDAVMTVPAVNAIRKNYPLANIGILAKPWVAEVYRLIPLIDEIILFEEPGEHQGASGKWHLARALRNRKFDLAVLLQNAVEAAIISVLAGIPLRAGYDTDARTFFLTHPVHRDSEIRKVHQVKYYLEMLRALGLETDEPPTVRLNPGDDHEKIAGTVLRTHNIEAGFLVGMAPGAAYGPAKRWLPERFAALANRIIDRYGASVVLFGSRADRGSADAVSSSAETGSVFSLAGETGLRETISLIAGCRLFISNDSGLMHLASALGVPTIGIFGSTNPVTTGPAGDKSAVIYKKAGCSPCLKQECPTDFRCMESVGVDEVYGEVEKLVSQ